ncbi:ComF family protein [uncultured Selenomonas sp.]|uniref:ComF family protein n=1 Tax=uncultured Selenomonas sp. TaxID=159275 RepID=UPI0025DBB2E0|nr:double zinc ribbon domain-containing protein [uncultured Selenomonas sp.]
MFDILLNFLFPPRCPACERYVEVRGGWCAACLAKAAAVRRLRTIAEAWALGIYEGALRDLVRHLKYQKKMDALPYLQTFLHAVEEDFFRAADVSPHPVAVPVPLFAAKEKKRGFNQTELIFKDWLKEHAIPMERLLVRTRATKPQYGLSKEERRENLRGAFSVPAEKQQDVRGRDVLLLDDIYTTGVTCAECARALKKAGARNIIVLALTSGQK